MAVDLGKQYGPLPLGAWIAVVGVGLGIAWYTRRSGAEPTVVENTSGTPGVGVGGAAGGWSDVSAPTTPTNKTPTTNEEWAQQAAQWLIAMGYPSAAAQQAVSKYVSTGNSGLSAQEYSMIALALVAKGPLPQGVPVVPDPPAGDPPLTAMVLAGWDVNRWLNDMKGINQSLNLDYATLQVLNPNLNIVNGHFGSTGTIRIR